MTTPGDHRAHWLGPGVIAWTGVIDAAHRVALHHRPGVRGTGPSTQPATPAPRVIPLTPGAPLPPIVEERSRHLRGATGLALPTDVDRTTVAGLLRGHLEVVVTDDAGRLIDRTGVQIPGVLDALYADAAATVTLGVSFEAGVPTVRLWAPTALAVTLHLFDDPQPADRRLPLAGSTAVAMTVDPASGVWSAVGDASWDRRYYLYDVEVVVPDAGRVVSNVATDPYARSLSCDSTRSQLVDLAADDLAPAGWWEHPTPPATSTLPVIYELHVRDHSASDPSVPAALVGTYLAFTLPDSHGMQHLRSLATAGVTHLQLLPVTDFATVPERRSAQLVPHIDRPRDPASELPQAIVAETRARQAHAWGYDPLHPGVPEGSYATDPDGPARIVELRRMVQALHGIGLRVVLDVVFNHTHKAGQDPASVLDRIVPGYHHRRSVDGRIEDSTCCPNLAVEHRMTGRYVVDTVRDWARWYRVDGFRFDLMGHHPRANMEAVRDAVHAVDDEVLVYGEGWDFGEVAGGARFDQATQANLAGTGIAAFDDRLRDGVRGGGPGRDPRAQGWATGLAGAQNDSDQGDAATVWRRAILHQRWVQVGMAGSLAAIELPVPERGQAAVGRRRGDDIHFGAGRAGTTLDPVDRVGYVSVHDDETLFDAITLKAPTELPIDERVRMQQVALSVAVLSQGAVLLHAGCELLRSKSLDRDSYASGDWFNQLDWTRTSHALGIGLPPAEKNGDRWPLLREVLRTRPRPQRRHLDDTVAQLRELLAIRRGSSGFAMRTGDEVRARLRFHLVGGIELPGLIVLEIDGRDDPDLLVVANARPEPVWVTLPSDASDASDASGRRWELHPVQRRSWDERVRSTVIGPDGDAQGASVAARTVAVLVRAADDETATG